MCSTNDLGVTKTSTYNAFSCCAESLTHRLHRKFQPRFQNILFLLQGNVVVQYWKLSPYILWLKVTNEEGIVFSFPWKYGHFSKNTWSFFEDLIFKSKFFIFHCIICIIVDDVPTMAFTYWSRWDLLSQRWGTRDSSRAEINSALRKGPTRLLEFISTQIVHTRSNHIWKYTPLPNINVTYDKYGICVSKASIHDTIRKVVTESLHTMIYNLAHCTVVAGHQRERWIYACEKLEIDTVVL